MLEKLIMNNEAHSYQARQAENFRRVRKETVGAMEIYNHVKGKINF